MTVESETRFDADVLVVGGGPAGAWAALTAKHAGAESVLLVDKGYCGTSGATASANTGVWVVSGEERERAIGQRLAQGGGLARREVMEAVLDTTAMQLASLEGFGFTFPVDDEGLPYRKNLRGPDYMAFMRRLLRRAGVRILDHSPAQELLMSDGEVAGAAGHRLHEDEPYRVYARSVVLASGGVAFLSKTLGCDVNTGDGLLMAAEVGASLSGMEFSAQYGICPAYSSVTKGLPYFWATFSDESGRVLESTGDRMLTVARGLLDGKVFAVLDKAPPEVQRWLRAGQPNCFLPHDRLGIDPFTQRFPVTLRCEGTVRGTGGIHLRDDACRTDVRGLFAAGDAASREALVGSATGGGAPNAAWAISSGSWAGRAAAEHARARGPLRDARIVRPAGGVGLRPLEAAREVSVPGLIEAARGELLPIEKNMFRTGAQLERSLALLDDAFGEARAHLAATGRARVRAREAAALLACGRYAYRSALARGESRGLHRRLDRPALDPAQTRSLRCTGVDTVAVHPAPQEARGAP